MKDVVQNSFEDDDLGDEDIDHVFARLDQLNPPADLVHDVMQAVSGLPLPQVLQSDDERTWDYEGLIVHHERKQSS